MKLPSLFKKEPKKWDLQDGNVIIPAFIDRGVQYYELKDLFNTFTARGLAALQVYEEWDMRLQKQDLQNFILAFEKVLRNQKEINIMDMVKIVEMLKERLTFPIATEDICYKFAAIRYFDENESPYKIDPDYINEKVQRWKEADSEVDHFFITQRLQDMLPLPKLSEDVLKKCLTAIKEVSDYQLNYIQQLNSQE